MKSAGCVTQPKPVTRAFVLYVIACLHMWWSHAHNLVLSMAAENTMPSPTPRMCAYMRIHRWWWRAHNMVSEHAAATRGGHPWVWLNADSNEAFAREAKAKFGSDLIKCQNPWWVCWLVVPWLVGWIFCRSAGWDGGWVGTGLSMNRVSPFEKSM